MAIVITESVLLQNSEGIGAAITEFINFDRHFRGSGFFKGETMIATRKKYDIDGDEYCTPPEYIVSVKEVFGGKIDLDPASSEFGQGIVQAEAYYTKEMDSLTRNWFGNIYLNRPYSKRMTTLFVDKFINEWSMGHIESAILLINNATDTKWFKRLCELSHRVCLVTGRINFIHPDPVLRDVKNNSHGQIFLYYGKNADIFSKVFSRHGVIL